MKKLVFVIFLSLLAIVAFAHEEEGQISGGYRLEFLSDVNVSTGVDTNIEFRIEDASTNETLTGLNVYFVFEDGNRVDLQERTGTYYASYKFPREALYEIHEFFVNGERIAVDFHINAFGKTYSTMNYVYYAIPFLGLIGLLYFGMKKKWKIGVGIFVLSLILTGLGYSVSFYFSSGAAREGIIVCGEDPTNCTWQAHVHSLIVPEICGVEERFRIEVGLLNESHTHEEHNVLHWHDRLPYDSTQSRILNTAPLRLDNSLNSIEYGIDTSKCSGTLKIFSNKENYWTKNTDWKIIDMSYVWSDRDIIYIAYDNRSEQEVLDYLGTTRFSFPTLGPA